jgi:hypothetical protein
MNERANLSDIKPGTPVYGIDGKQLGPVESVGEDHCIRVLAHRVPSAAIDHVDDDGIHLCLAQAAFAAAPPITRNTAAAAEA